MTGRRHPTPSPDLSWLRGFPRGLPRASGLPWLAFPEPGRGSPARILVDPARLQAAGRALDRVPRGGSPQRRRARRLRRQLTTVRALVETPVSAWRDQGICLPRPQAKVWAQTPALRACARGLAFLNLGDPRAAQRLAVVDRHADALAAILEAGPQPQLRAALALADLLCEHEDDLAPALIALCGEAPRLARPGQPALEDLEARLERLSLRKPAESPPAEREPATETPLLLARHFLTLRALPRGERRRQVRALAILPPFDRERRQAFWSREATLRLQVESLERTAQHSRSEQQSRSERSRFRQHFRVRPLALARAQSELRALRPDAPLAYLDSATLEQLSTLAGDSALTLLLRHAQDLPLASRSAWFSGWARLLADSRRPRALRAIPQVGRWLRRGSRVALSLRLHLLSSLDTAIGAYDSDVRENLRALGSFLEAASGLTSPHLPPLGLWQAGLRAGRGPEPLAWGQALAELLLRNPKAWEWIEARGYSANLILAKVAGADPERLEHLLIVLHEAALDYSEEHHLDEVVNSLLLADPEGGRELAYQLLTGESPRLLARLGLGLEAYRELRGYPLPLAPPAPSLRAPSWARAFPRQLWPLLRALDATAARPRTAVERALRSVLPGPVSLQAEIQALRRKVRHEGDRGGIYQRLQSLERRLATAATPAPARIQRARLRLEGRLRRARLSCLEAALDDALHRALQVEVPGLPRAWLQSATLRPLILHAAVLDEEQIRPQAWALLRRRLQGPLSGAPWDLRDLEPNRRFLRRLAARGLDLEPWVEGRSVSVVPAPGGCVVLSLENDPLEALRMGEHFETCLSPDDINYYSAISNALDVNKRVLYARDLEGRVVGRCLLALGAEGGLVAHHPYSHEASLCFDRLASDYVRALAARIGTRPVAAERIPLLVAEEWYDDSPVDLCETEAFLRDSASEFRRSLPTLDPWQLPEVLRQACLGSPPARVVAGLLALPELVERPELALGLLGSTRGLRGPALLTLATLTRRAGSPEASADLLRRLLRRPPRKPEQLRSLVEELLARRRFGPALRLARRQAGLQDLAQGAQRALKRPTKPLREKNLRT